MPRVGILSMQRILNYGSFLQAYGLKSILEELGCDVEFVDYHPGKCLLPVENESGISRKLAKGIEVLKQKAPITEKIRFIQYKRQYAAKYYPYLGIDDKMNYVPELDVLVIGSDEVFNCVQSNTNVGFSPELFGDGHHAKKLISYAASFGNTTIEKLEKYGVRETISNLLEGFDSLSVRDSNSGSIVEELTGKQPEYHFDPVLVYGFIGRCKEIPQSVGYSSYMIVYGYSGRFSKEECRTIRAYATQKGLKILCIGGVQRCCDRFIDCSPFEVIAYFQHADCVVTDTFHGTILSVITKRRFGVFVRRQGYGNGEKLEDLLARLKLGEREISNIEMLNNVLASSVNYKETELIIETARKNAYAYLNGMLV